MANSVRVSVPTGKRVRYNPYVGKRKSIIYHILSKVSTIKSVNKKEKSKYSSYIDNLKMDMFLISEEVEREYNLYKLRKGDKSKKHTKKFSFYNSDGSFNCIGILLGMCSDDSYIREKSIRLLFMNLDKILNSEDFRDLTTFIFSCSVFIYFYCSLFFNVTEFVKYNLGLIL